jgi:hypothetical protein
MTATATAAPVARVSFDRLSDAMTFDALLVRTRMTHPELKGDRITLSTFGIKTDVPVIHVFASQRLIDTARADVKRELDSTARAVNDARFAASLSEMAYDDAPTDANFARVAQTSLRVSALIALLVHAQDMLAAFKHVTR